MSTGLIGSTRPEAESLTSPLNEFGRPDSPGDGRRQDSGNKQTAGWQAQAAGRRLRMTRRCLSMVGALTRGLALMLAFQAAASAQVLPSLDLGDGVHVLPGSTSETRPANRGEVGNAGFIVGASGTVVINTGASYRHGRRILETAESVGGKPVVAAIITQPLQEFIMGSAAFAERGIPLLAHEAAAQLIADRCETCLRNLTRLLGAETMFGTRVVVPTRTVTACTEIEPGGRSLQLLHYGWGSTPGDLAVFDPATGTLFAGALVSSGRIPELRDADVDGWLHALDALAALRPRVIVPGYGPPAPPDHIAQIRRYIELARSRVQTLQHAGSSLFDTIQAADVAEFATWDLYAVIHPRNVQRLYLQEEAVEFGR